MNITICVYCRQNECDLCRDTWKGMDGDEMVCVCECNKDDLEFDKYIPKYNDRNNDDIW